MGKQFFNSWALWQKMTFVLACAIVVTILLGFVKLRYDTLKLRKYSKVEKGKTAQTPEMLEAQPVRHDTEGDCDIPFGVRAIESGIEVDGVWISRSNTPVGSSRSSMADVKLPRSLDGSNLELPKLAYASSSRDSSRAPSSAFDRAVSAERVPINDSRSNSPIYDNFHGRAAYPSSSRLSQTNIRDRDSTTLSALEGSEGGFSPVRHQPNQAQASSAKSGQSSSRASDESDYMNIRDSRPYEAAYLHPKQAPLAPVDPRTDLDLLQSHRLSHVAETGQLTPRVRRPGNSGEWAQSTENTRAPQEIASSNGVDYFVPQQKSPSPPAVATSPEELPATSSSMFNDIHVSNQTRQGVPLLETYEPQAYQPRGPQYDDGGESAYPVQTQQNQRESNVVRKVNSGFEILKPGTFGEPTSPEEEQPSEKRQSKRLQKRRKSSAASRTSHFVEQV